MRQKINGFLLSGLILGFFVGAQSVQADEVRTLAGVRFSLAAADFTGVKDAEGAGKGVLLGVSYPEYRVYADMNFYSWDKASTRSIHANYDRLWSLHEDWHFYAGVYGGIADFELEKWHQTKQDYQSGLSYGVQSGVTYRLADQWQIDAGLRYNKFHVEIYSPALQRDVRMNQLAEFFLTLSFGSKT